MTPRAILTLIATIAFAVSPFLVPGFGGFDPEQFPVPQIDPPVQPAGYAFGIWGVIYLWLIASALFGVWKRGEDGGWDAVRLPLTVSLAVGAAWLAVAVASPVWATVLIWAMLVPAIWALLRTPDYDRGWLRMPVGLYAGWLTAASAVSIGLLAAGWGVMPFGQVGWAIVALSVGLVVALVVSRRMPLLTYPLAVVWALIAVVVQNGLSVVGVFAGVAALAVLAIAGARWQRD